jgi:hypothetical protein
MRSRAYEIRVADSFDEKESIVNYAKTSGMSAFFSSRTAVAGVNTGKIESFHILMALTIVGQISIGRMALRDPHELY